MLDRFLMKPNDRRLKFRVCFAKGTVEIPLTCGKWAIIDIQDSEKVLRARMLGQS
jgi:hypothetical protein